MKAKRRVSVLEAGGGWRGMDGVPPQFPGKGGAISGRGQETLTGPTSCRSTMAALIIIEDSM